ncbi:DEAD/DEAH box helicase family protein [Pseudovibrio sp. Ad26]|uniref:EcoAI/FtnUII family type I restriction enzme subunit R n=1 Tax=Pseudovibrio sp. Ad26 TaxID=989410 RepID=UPI0007AE4653|nr:DEAD/DEAH box helicase family protein [Pseudovibrio sp. Ad26]KZL05560.1 Type-1 restriction enzyme R protein [Pseudovibrio sp. Ad26]
MLTKEEKKKLSESDICDLYITPAIKNSGWDPYKQIRREVTLTPGPIIVRGNVSSRNSKKKKYADYVLYWQLSQPIAVVEAKDNNHEPGQGMQQALGYAEILEVPSAYSTNGDAFEEHNNCPLAGELIEQTIQMDNFPTPEALWERYKRDMGLENTRQDLISEPYFSDGSGKEPRYYQAEAINRTVEAISKGQNRVLLVMATGTGKTYTTFQIIWRLWQAGAAKRILFLADRNILVDQTLVNDFKPFSGKMKKISGREIDPAYEIHLGLYQALTGTEEKDKIFKTVSPDFFDLIVVDECHRGSAAEDAAWREILEYFNSATQIGLTATPKETRFVSNSTYFGKAVYTYSLKQGIEDGFLAPYKVVRIDIDKDIEGWNPPPGAVDDLGEEIEERKYNQKDMDRILVLNKRTTLVAERVMKLLKATDPFSKTIIFCEDIDHAERMRRAIVNAAGKLALDNPKYVMRITGDSPEGKAELDNFIDPESKFPVIATTSKLLTTGVDAKTCKLIVIDRTVCSLSIFKQMIGRGTRVDEEHGKYYFTIMDFKKATELFKDPKFDGDPVVIYQPEDDDPPEPPDPEDPEDDGEGGGGGDPPLGGIKKFRVSGVDVNIIAERVSYLDPDGELITESYKDFAKKQVQNEFSSLNDFINRWNEADKKAVIIAELEECGVLLENLEQEVGKDFGDFDLLLHVAYDQPPLTRAERANNVKKRDYFTKYGEQARKVLAALLDKYADEGIQAIEDARVLRMHPFNEIGSPVEIIKGVFGGKVNYEEAIRDLEEELYRQASG